MKQFFWILLLLFSLLLQATLTSFPLIVVVLLLWFVFSPSAFILVTVFVAGIVFDMLTVTPIGQTSVVLLVLLFGVYLYQRKFEADTIPFVFLTTTGASFLFVLLVGFGNAFLQAILAGAVATGFFLLKLFFSQQMSKQKSIW